MTYNMTLIMIVTFTVISVGMIVLGAAMFHDMEVSMEDAAAWMSDYNMKRSCEDLKEEMDRYDRLILSSAPEYLSEPYREKCQ